MTVEVGFSGKFSMGSNEQGRVQWERNSETLRFRSKARIEKNLYLDGRATQLSTGINSLLVHLTAAPGISCDVFLRQGPYKS